MPPVLRYKSDLIDLVAEPGEIVGVTGRPNTGKTTLVRTLGGVYDAPDGVTVELDGDVGFLVAAIPVGDPGAYLIPPFEVSLRPVSDPPAVVLADEPFEAIGNQEFVDLAHGVLDDMSKRGAAVVVASCVADTIADEFCDRIVSLDGTAPTPRAELIRAAQKVYGARRLSTDPVEQVRELVDVRREGLPVVDPKEGAFVLLPGLRWHAWALASWTHWFVVPPAVMAAMIAPPDGAIEPHDPGRVDAPSGVELEADEYDDGPWHGLAASPEWLAGRVSYDPSDPASTVSPLVVVGGVDVAFTSDPQPRSAVFDVFPAGSPVVPSAEECAELVERYRERMGRLAGDRGGRQSVDVPARDPVAAKVLELVRAANRRWWRLDVSVFKFSMVRYGPGNELARHADNYVGRECNKVSAIVQLSPPDAYEGGAILADHHDRHPPCDDVEWFDDAYLLPRPPGTVLAFPSWLSHTVESVTAGERFALLLFGYGPPFR